MLNKKTIICTWIMAACCLMISSFSAAQTPDNALGQIIQIQTRFRSFTGKPSWLLVIRDLDHQENIPYLFDIRKGENVWIAFTYSKNYLIVASQLQFSPYKYNPYRQKRISNFCRLESRGRILRGKSISVMITGKLTPNPDTFTCYVSIYPDPIPVIVKPAS